MTSFSPDRLQDSTDPQIVYRAVNLWAVASLILGALSFTAAFDRLFLFIPLAGALAGWKALRQLRRFRDVQTGEAFARAGIAASIAFGLAGSIVLYCLMSDVPYGYKEITFEELQPNPGESVSQAALEFQPTMSEDRRVFIRGYIYPGRRTRGIKEFMLVPTVSHCSFCSTQLRPTDLIRVKLGGDLAVDFRSTPVAVGGRFRVDQSAAQAPYAIEADHVQ